MKIIRELDNEEIIEIISEQMGIPQEDLFEDVEIESKINGFRCCLEYIKPKMEIQLKNFNKIW